FRSSPDTDLRNASSSPGAPTDLDAGAAGAVTGARPRAGCAAGFRTNLGAPTGAAVRSGTWSSDGGEPAAAATSGVGSGSISIAGSGLGPAGTDSSSAIGTGSGSGSGSASGSTSGSAWAIGAGGGGLEEEPSDSYNRLSL